VAVHCDDDVLIPAAARKLAAAITAAADEIDQLAQPQHNLPPLRGAALGADRAAARRVAHGNDDRVCHYCGEEVRVRRAA
jgi:hypothetical protein